MNKNHSSNIQAEKLLIAFFERNGCVRQPDLKRKRELGQKYKKGYEVRLTARTKEELDTMRRLLQQSGFISGKPYGKALRYIQPVYGKFAVDWFTSRAKK